MIDVLASLLPFVKDTSSLRLTFEKSEGDDYLMTVEMKATIVAPRLDDAEEEPEVSARFLDGTPIR